jgi:hypothetical protein
MKSGLLKAAVAVTALVFTGISYGETTVKLNPTGFVSFNVGEIVHANPLSATHASIGAPVIDAAFLQRIFAGFSLQASYDPLPITTNVALELKVYNQIPREENTWIDLGLSQRIFYLPYITRADFVYSPSNAFNLDIGYFPFKYNEDARNLGEYLFRSGTYPQYLITNFDFAAARVSGLRTSGVVFNDLHWDALLTANFEFATIGDLNFTGIASYTLLDKFVELGGGVSFCSFISADKKHTQPKISTNEADMYEDNNSDSIYIPTMGSFVGDTFHYSNYTFAGTKLMGRVSIDPKRLFSCDIFGKEDLRLYGEAAILGVKNYPMSIDSSTRYTDILKRMPIMFGFNIPTFKLLDVLSMEWEWFGSPYPNDMETIYMEGLPIAQKSFKSGYTSTYADSTNDNWKWSFYARKTLAGHFNVVFQFASDHLRWEWADYGKQAQLQNEALTKRWQKYFILKLGYSF